VEYGGCGPLLDDRDNANKYMFIRNIGLVSENINERSGPITFDGNRSKKEIFTLDWEELKSNNSRHPPIQLTENVGVMVSELIRRRKGTNGDYWSSWLCFWTGFVSKNVLKRLNKG